MKAVLAAAREKHSAASDCRSKRTSFSAGRGWPRAAARPPELEDREGSAASDERLVRFPCRRCGASGIETEQTEFRTPYRKLERSDFRVGIATVGIFHLKTADLYVQWPVRILLAGPDPQPGQTC